MLTANLQIQNIKINSTYVFQEVVIFIHISFMQKEEWTEMGQFLDLHITTKLFV